MKIYQNYITSKDTLFKTHSSMQDADFTQHLQTERIAAHWVVMPPHSRSSSPHAESHEEEFVYVISGRPHIWINGYIYQLTENMCVGFTAGTGIAHTLINNTDQNVELLVLGEKTKPHNKCSFPLNPEKSSDAIFWADSPAYEIGPHDGAIGNTAHLRDWQSTECIKSIVGAKRDASFSYPQDTETFGNGVRLTDLVGLKKLGVWHEILKPEKRSAWPHAHKVEEELAIVLSGTAQVWLNGYTYDLKKGDAVYFKPNSRVSHVLINNTSEDFEYIGLGEAFIEGEKDLIYYPLHATRNEQCRKHEFYWHDIFAAQNFGDDLGLPEVKSVRIVEKKELSSFLVYQNEKMLGTVMLAGKNLVMTEMTEPILKKLVEFLIENKTTFNSVIGPSICSEAVARIYATLTSRRYVFSSLHSDLISQWDVEG